jgi:type I restriction enzyme S subunit
MDPTCWRSLGEVKRGYVTFQDGDVLFAKITPCMENGKSAVAHSLASSIGFGSTEFHVLRPARGVNRHYLYYFISQQSFRQAARARMTGTAGQLRVPAGFLAEAQMPVPPIAEQQRIVAAIEQQFTRLDAGVATLRRVQTALKRYRAAVLKAAVEGKLTEEWRAEHPDVEPASTLLSRTLAERRARWEANPRTKGKDPAKANHDEPKVPDTKRLPALPVGWCTTSTGQVTECLDSMRIPVNKEERAKREGQIPYFGANGRVGWIDDFLFDEPLVLVVEDETFTGREVPFSYKITGKTWVNNHAHVLRATGAVTVDYLNYSLAHYPFTPLTTGSTGRRKLTQKALMEAPYVLPPLAEQEAIVAEVEDRLSVIAALEATVEANLKRAERLRQSILERAFSGRLVPQDPNDEPASVLLKRIRQERTVLDATRHTSKTPDQVTALQSISRASQGTLWRAPAVSEFDA